MVLGAPSSLVIVKIEICRDETKKRTARNTLQRFAFRTIVSPIQSTSFDV